MKQFISLLFVCCLASPASAQLIFTSSQYLSQYSSTQPQDGYQDTAYNTSDLQSLINMTGANQTWIFGGQNWLDDGTYTSSNQVIPYPGNAPLASNFPEATHVLVNSYVFMPNFTFYQFWKIDETGAWELGEIQDSSGVPSEIHSFTPPVQYWKFPLTYQTSWQSTSNLNPTEEEYPAGAIITQSMTGICDGYGTVTLAGHSESALRVKIENAGAASYLGVSLGGDSSYTYYWITQSGSSAQINADQSGNALPNQATFGVVSASGVTQPQTVDDPITLRLSQNPASNSGTKLNYTMKQDGSIQVMLMDPVGRDVRMLLDGRGHAGQNELPIDAASLASGSYFLRVVADGQPATVKLLITK